MKACRQWKATPTNAGEAMTIIVALLFGVYAYAIDRGYAAELARTIALNTLVVMEIFHLFFIRNIYGTSLTWKTVRGTKVVWAVVGVITVAQFAITYLPSLQAIFATQSIPFLLAVQSPSTSATR